MGMELESWNYEYSHWLDNTWSGFTHMNTSFARNIIFTLGTYLTRLFCRVNPQENSNVCQTRGYTDSPSSFWSNQLTLVYVHFASLRTTLQDWVKREINFRSFLSRLQRDITFGRQQPLLSARCPAAKREHRADYRIYCPTIVQLAESIVPLILDINKQMVFLRNAYTRLCSPHM